MGPSRLLLGFVVALVVCLIQIRASVESEEKMFPVAESEVVTDEEVNREIMKFRGTRQKRWVATAIGAGITLLGGLFSRNQAKQMARMYEKQMKFKLHELCVAICAEEWSMWTRCTQNCGVGGTRERTRKHSIIGKCKELSNFQCPHSKLQKQACNEGCPHGGTPNGTICACAPGWMSDCCTTEVRCKFPGKPSNGKVHGNWPAKFGHVVTYTCDEGYYLDGAESMECVGQGDWTKGGKVPTCKEIMCDPPSANPHLTILNPSSQGYLYGEEVVFRCAEGYVLRGPDKRVCIKHRKEKGRLTGFTPTCAAVSCGYPGLPLHGEIHGTKFNYKSTVNFTCATGFKLLGSQSLVCMANGKWLGMVPKCVQIECEPPFVPKNAEARIRQKSTLGTIVTFTCKDGYVLEGQRSLKCQADGQWNGTEPICKAADCGDPGRPENGARDGSVYHYPYNVTYSCFTGYKLKGLPTIHCQKSGKWSSKAPSCEACPLNHYMDALDKPGICQPCPDHTYTVTNGSRGRQQCMCKKGYKGPPGGPCIEIKCDLLYAPDDGVMDTCSNKVGSSCVFGCKDGFIIDRGSSQRTCQEDGNWDGTEPHCSPCPLHTYKSSEGSCMPCPPYSKTNSTGNMIKGCRCIKGYKGPPGGKCVDINECLENNGRGDCEDLCENRPGSFICGCSIPGYKLDDDKRHCIVEKECKNLTKAVLPENGGVVCHHYYEENSKQCKILCNKGYDFPSRVNDYEYCGPTTAYKWTFQSEDETAVMDPCIPELYPGYQQLSETDYFVRACDELTDVEKKAVFEEFKKVLDKNQICKTRATKVCNVKDMWIQCGNKTQVRRKRGVMETVSPVNLGFTIESQKMGTRREDCPRICQTLRIPSRFCDRLCEPAYKRFLQASVVVARRQLRDLYQRKKNAAKFKAAGRDFDPSGGINSGPVEMKCDPGQEGRWKTASCVPCNAGTYLDEKRKACVKCPVGTFQPLQGQSACVKCPTGSSNSKPGSLFCLICPPGKYGDMCNRTCECVHGSCDPRTGDCKCKSGWEGPRCDIDIPGCRDATCFRGVACTDIPAPATGFKCGPCPRGYFGDGATCTRRTEL